MQPLSDPMVMASETPLTEALKRMTQEDTNHFLVKHDSTLQGMITKMGWLPFLEIKRMLQA